MFHEVINILTIAKRVDDLRICMMQQQNACLTSAVERMLLLNMRPKQKIGNTKSFAQLIISVQFIYFRVSQDR